MKLLMLALTLLVIVGVYLLWILNAGIKNKLIDSSSEKVLIIVKDQEAWVEGFIRKLFRCIKNMPRAEVLVVDDFSCDRTPEVLSRLQRYYPFEFLSAREGDTRTVNWARGAEGNFAGAQRFDVRGLKGRDLLHAPLFYHLSHFNAGKLQVLSKR